MKTKKALSATGGKWSPTQGDVFSKKHVSPNGQICRCYGKNKEVNARRITTAVNSFDTMLKALKGMLSFAKTHRPYLNDADFVEYHTVMAEIEAAIMNAK